MKVSPNGMTSQPPTPLLLELDVFFSPLSEHFGPQMGLPDPFVILTDLTGHGGHGDGVTVKEIQDRRCRQKRRQTFFAVRHSSDCSDFCSLFEVT